jgi:hypothetical protein
VGGLARPSFVDLNGDGDLDAFIGTSEGHVFFARNNGTITSPGFAAGSMDPFGLGDVGAYSAPVLCDLDGDGDAEALVGNEDGDTIFFENIRGPVPNPIFAKPVTHPFGLGSFGGYVAPALADIDGDGDIDMLAGNDLGQLVLSPNVGTATSPDFTTPVVNPFGLSYVGLYNLPAFGDIDGDGDLDVFVGQKALYLERNTGTATSPAFAAASALPFALGADVYHVAPRLVDIDGDGDLDAFLGSSYEAIYVFANTGTATSAAFAAGVASPGFGSVEAYSSPDLVDLDGDGDLDALIGGASGQVTFFRNTGTRTSPAFATGVVGAFGFQVGTVGVPATADIDGDGALDVFIGQGQGNVSFFRNLTRRLLFEDDFESGDLSGWSSHVP